MTFTASKGTTQYDVHGHPLAWWNDHPSCRSCLHSVGIFCSRNNPCSTCKSWSDSMWSAFEAAKICSARYKSTGTATMWSSTAGSDTGRYKSTAGSSTPQHSTAGHTDVPWVMTRLSPPIHNQHTLESGQDPRAVAAATPRRQVVYQDRSHQTGVGMARGCQPKLETVTCIGSSANGWTPTSLW